jgi:hypothetical protein
MYNSELQEPTLNDGCITLTQNLLICHFILLMVQMNSRVASYGVIFTLNLAKGQSNGLADFKKGQTDILT